jgi:AsmA protein
MRGLIRGVLGLGVLVAVAAGAVALIPASRIAALGAAEFERVTGRALTIGGAVRASVWPVLGVSAEDVAVADAPWAGPGPMLAADRVALGVDLGALFAGTIRITEVAAVGARLRLVRDAEGRANWDFQAAQGGAAPAAEGAVATPFALDRLRLTDAAVSVTDAGATAEVAGLDATLSAPDPAGPVDFDLTAVLNGQAVAVEGRAEGFARALSGAVVPLLLTAEAGGSTARFEGRAGLAPLAAEGRVVLDAGDLRALAALAATAAPDLPQGLGARERRLEGMLTLAPEGSVHLREGQVTLDGNALSLAADVILDGPRPKISAEVAAGVLAIPGLSGSGGGGGGGGGAGWPADPLDATALGLADASVALRADSLTASGITIAPLRAMLTVDRARAVLDLREAGLYGGQIAGQLVANNRSGLSVGGDLRAGGIALQDLLRAAGLGERLVATGEGRLAFLGAGQSVAAIMASLSGEGAFALGKGELIGLDLAGMLRTLDTGYVGAGQKTIFDAIRGSFSIAGGVLANEDLALAAPYVSAGGKGTVGLGAQVLDYTLTPTALVAEDGTGGVRVPLRISGPWSAPSFALDLAALAEQELADEREKLKAAAEAEAARLKAEAEAKAAEALGVTPAEGESLQDAAERTAREKLEAEAADALKGLLGGN